MTDLVQEVAELDEVDLRLINALQLDPRAPWSRVADALDLDPVTVARRWARLFGAGAAWVSAHAGRGQFAEGCTAFVEVDCEASQADAVASTLARWPHVLTVEHTSGARDLLLTVIVPSLSALSRYVLESIGSLPGVRTTRSQVVTDTYAIGGDWRLRALAPQERARLADGSGNPHPAARPLTETDKKLILGLCRDGRASLTDLAAAASVSVTTARRRVRTLLASRSVLLRCDLAQPLSGWPVSTWIWAQVPAGERDEVARRLATLPDTRACFALTGGPASLLYCTWLRSLADAQQAERQLTTLAPDSRVIDRAVVLRFVKRVGYLLDDAGRRTGVVPTDVWSDPVRRAREAQRRAGPN